MQVNIFVNKNDVNELHQVVNGNPIDFKIEYFNTLPKLNSDLFMQVTLTYAEFSRTEKDLVYVSEKELSK